MSYNSNFESIMAVNQRGLDTARRLQRCVRCCSRASLTAATAITNHFSLTALLKDADEEWGESWVLDCLWV